MNILDTIQRALASAGLDPQAGPMKGVTDTIGKALASAGVGPRAATTTERASVIEVVAGEAVRQDDDGDQPKADASPAHPGEFFSRAYSNPAGTRSYKLYVPARLAAGQVDAAPMVVMLHGCTQSPDDFAAGTRMNDLADRHGFVVVYPEQSANANGSRCWNWFQPGDQARDAGEPSLIAGITREVASQYNIDEDRIFVAGLSAGAAMAIILGATYPDLYAAVGAHSGLPFGAAHDMASAFGAMNGAGAGPGTPTRARSTASGRGGRRFMPTIVFHGDRDHTVNVRNGTAIVEQVLASAADEPPLRATVHEGVASVGRSYRHVVHADARNRPFVEQWVLHGAGHAWSGGSPGGSFTDPKGPDASAEMVRFFYSQSRPGRS